MDADICNIRLRTGWQNAPYFAEYLSHMLSSSFNIARYNHPCSYVLVLARLDIQLAGTEFERLNAGEDEYPRT